MKILTAADMAATDRVTAEDHAIPIAILMENAGAAVAAFIARQHPAAKRILVLCGKGNNGGDGLVAARYLSASKEITVALLAEESAFQNEAAAALKALKTTPATLKTILDEPSLTAFDLTPYDLIVDAVLGTGFKPPLRPLAAALRTRLTDEIAGKKNIVAIDIPTGWDADSRAQTSPDAFPADAVVTFTAPKLAHVFGHLTPNTSFGPIVIANIGSPEEAIVSSTHLHWTGSSKPIAEKPRDINANKGKFGHVLLIGGSYGTAGAPSMSALAALRTGAGLVTAAVPDSILPLVARIAPELMLAPLVQGPEGALSLSNLAPDQLPAFLKSKKFTVLALGPGLSTRGEVSEFVRRLVAETTLPLVLDADALNAFDGRADRLTGETSTGENRTLVLTPHPGEMARLTGLTIKEVEADRANIASLFAVTHKLTLVLNGWRTLIAHPDGRIAVNTSGNPAMAKGGSGDILTGIVAALLAQFPDRVAEAVETAVYLHGLAADFAAQLLDEHTVLATDTLDHLTNAFRYRTTDADNLTWLTGIQPGKK